MARKELPRIDRDKILGAVDIVDVIKGYGVNLKKSGKEWEACCPFHKDKSPSFKVVPDRQFYYCHGCGASGDAIRFVTDFEQMSFVDACKVLSGGDLRQVNNLTPLQRDSVKINAQPEWEPIIPAPAGIPDPTFIYRRMIDGEWMGSRSKIYPYRDMGSQLIGYVVRFLHPVTGKKSRCHWCGPAIPKTTGKPGAGCHSRNRGHCTDWIAWCSSTARCRCYWSRARSASTWPPKSFIKSLLCPGRAVARRFALSTSVRWLGARSFCGATPISLATRPLTAGLMSMAD